MGGIDELDGGGGNNRLNGRKAMTTSNGVGLCDDLNGGDGSDDLDGDPSLSLKGVAMTAVGGGGD